MTHPPARSDDDRLHLEIRLGEHHASVRVCGSLNGASVAALALEIERLVATRLYRFIELDAADVATGDDAALRVLDDIVGACSPDGCEIRLANPSILVSDRRGPRRETAPASVARQTTSGSDEGATAAG